MAQTHQRVFALITALLFMATSLAGGAVVIWQLRKDNQAAKEASQVQSSDQDNNDTNLLDSNKNQPEVTQLQGTKLADFTPVASVANLQKIDLVEGTGEVVKPGATVTAHYTGALAADGIIFQSSHDGPNQPIPFGLDQVIKGWTDGVPGMKVGGKRRLLIPYALAYGEAGRPSGGIPPKADLVFDIELVAVQQ